MGLAGDSYAPSVGPSSWLLANPANQKIQAGHSDLEPCVQPYRVHADRL